MCGCEYCASVVDDYDDKIMLEEAEVAEYVGKEKMALINVGDTVQYYKIPDEWRKVVYTKDITDVQDKAIKTYTSKIISKTKNLITFLHEGNKREASFGNCFLLGMHKI